MAVALNPSPIRNISGRSSAYPGRSDRDAGCVWPNRWIAFDLNRSIRMDITTAGRPAVSTLARLRSRRSFLMGAAGVAGGSLAVAGGLAAMGGSGDGTSETPREDQPNGALAAQAAPAATPITAPDPGPGAAMFRGNPARTGEVAGPGPAEEPFVRWTFEAQGRVSSSPVVVDDTVYLGTTALFAVSIAGIERWRFAAGGQVRSSPAVAGGVVYVGDEMGTLFAVDAATG